MATERERRGRKQGKERGREERERRLPHAEATQLHGSTAQAPGSECTQTAACALFEQALGRGVCTTLLTLVFTGFHPVQHQLLRHYVHDCW